MKYALITTLILSTCVQASTISLSDGLAALGEGIYSSPQEVSGINISVDSNGEFDNILIFDSNIPFPNGVDDDLNVNIGYSIGINENDTNFDDEANGGTITFSGMFESFTAQVIDAEEGFFFSGITTDGKIFLSPPPIPGTIINGDVTNISFDQSFTEISLHLNGSGAIGNISFNTITPVPEPSSQLLYGLGVMTILFRRKRS